MAESDEEFVARTGMHPSWKHSKHQVHDSSKLKRHAKPFKEAIQR